MSLYFLIQAAILELKTNTLNTFGKMEKIFEKELNDQYIVHVIRFPEQFKITGKKWQVSMVFAVEDSQGIYNCIHRKPLKNCQNWYPFHLWFSSGTTLCIFFSVTTLATCQMKIQYKYRVITVANHLKEYIKISWNGFPVICIGCDKQVDLCWKRRNWIWSCIWDILLTEMWPTWEMHKTFCF